MKAALAVPILAAAALAAVAYAARHGQGEALDDLNAHNLSVNEQGDAITGSEPNSDTTDTMPIDKNVNAFLKMIREAEVSRWLVNPYAVVYAYEFTITDFSDHPANLGWAGGKLSDAMCKNAGLGKGCVSTAAGAYQFIKPTWNALARKLRLPDFSKDSQDGACIEKLRELGALQHIQAGNFKQALSLCGSTWASLPNNTYKQGGKSEQQLTAAYLSNGGAIA